MDKVEKFLRKIGKAEALRVRAILVQIENNDLTNMDVSKLRGESHCYRVRTGDKRIKFVKTRHGNLVYHVGFRNDNTY